MRNIEQVIVAIKDQVPPTWSEFHKELDDIMRVSHGLGYLAPETTVPLWHELTSKVTEHFGLSPFTPPREMAGWEIRVLRILRGEEGPK